MVRVILGWFDFCLVVYEIDLVLGFEFIVIYVMQLTFLLLRSLCCRIIHV